MIRDLIIVGLVTLILIFGSLLVKLGYDQVSEECPRGMISARSDSYRCEVDHERANR